MKPPFLSCSFLPPSPFSSSAADVRVANTWSHVSSVAVAHRTFYSLPYDREPHPPAVEVQVDLRPHRRAAREQPILLPRALVPVEGILARMPHRLAVEVFVVVIPLLSCSAQVPHLVKPIVVVSAGRGLQRTAAPATMG